MLKRTTKQFRTRDGSVDRTSLSALYPEAKTFDERAADDQQRQQLLMERQTKFARAKIALFSSLLFIIVGWFFITIYSMWASGSIFIIFISFFLAILCTWMIIGYFNYVAKIFYEFNRNMSAYIIAELLFIIAASLLIYFVYSPQNTMLYALCISAMVHFVSLYLFLLLVIRYQRF